MLFRRLELLSAIIIIVPACGRTSNVCRSSRGRPVEGLVPVDHVSGEGEIAQGLRRSNSSCSATGCRHANPRNEVNREALEGQGLVVAGDSTWRWHSRGVLGLGQGQELGADGLMLLQGGKVDTGIVCLFRMTKGSADAYQG